jgi:hypothetical protein
LVGGEGGSEGPLRFRVDGGVVGGCGGNASMVSGVLRIYNGSEKICDFVDKMYGRNGSCRPLIDS